MLGGEGRLRDTDVRYCCVPTMFTAYPVVYRLPLPTDAKAHHVSHGQVLDELVKYTNTRTVEWTWQRLHCNTASGVTTQSLP